MVKRDSPPILKEKWEYLDERTLDGHQIKVNGQEFFTFAAFGNLLFTPEEIETSRKRFMEWPNHSIIYPMWILDRDDIIESAKRLGVQIEENDFNEIIKAMRARIADTIGDAWDEVLDQEVWGARLKRVAVKE